MKKTITLFVFALSAMVVFAQSAKQTTAEPAKSTGKYANSKFEYKIIDAPNGTHGYDIIADGTPIVHQTSMPGVAGNAGFKTKMDAQNVAKIAIRKIQKGEFPPTITSDDLKMANINIQK